MISAATLRKVRRPYSRLETLALAWQGLVKNFYDPYRPERHYMRGPGPKWRAKHQASANAA